MTPRPALYTRSRYDPFGGGDTRAPYGLTIDRLPPWIRARMDRSQAIVKYHGHGIGAVALFTIDTLLDEADDLHGNDQGAGPA